LSITALEPPSTFVPADTEERMLFSENFSVPGPWVQTPVTERPARSKRLTPPLSPPLRNVTAVEELSAVEVWSSPEIVMVGEQALSSGTVLSSPTVILLFAQGKGELWATIVKMRAGITKSGN
jgi:hypothetical protein